jgi:hypothetical protein
MIFVMPSSSTTSALVAAFFESHQYSFSQAVFASGALLNVYRRPLREEICSW